MDHSPLTSRLLIVDNGSTDDTERVAHEMVARRNDVVLVSEPCAGLARARNTGLAHTDASVIMFTDDDIVVPADWIDKMSAQILADVADVVVGGIAIAPELRRPWMTTSLESYYAHVPDPPAINPGTVGANMAFRGPLIQKFRFDEELGTSKYPGHEDMLTYVRLRAYSARIRGVPDAQVTHFFGADRLGADSLLRKAEGYGRCDGYYFHHWLHSELSLQRLRLMWHIAQKAARQPWRLKNEYDERFILLAREVAFHQEMLRLRGTRRRYERHGLILNVDSAVGLDQNQAQRDGSPPTSGPS